MSNQGNLRLFSREERKRWQRYMVTLPEICKSQNWKKRYKPKLEHELELLSEDQLQKIRQTFDFHNNDSIENILSDTKRAVTIYCFWRFSEMYRASIARYLNLNVRGRALQKAAFIGTLTLSDDQLVGVLLYHVWRRVAIFERDYALRDVQEEKIDLLNNKARWLAPILSRGAYRQSEIHERHYHFKLKGKFHQYLIYWFIKLKSDEEEPSWPFNQRQKKFATKIIALDTKNKHLRLVVHNAKERRLILSFLQKRIGLELSFEQTDLSVSKNQFSNLFTSEDIAKTIPILGVTYKKSYLPGYPKLTVQDSASRTSVNDAIRRLEESNVTKSENIRDVAGFTILCNGQPAKIRILEGKVGYYKFSIPERSLNVQDREQILLSFEKNAKIPINKYFEFEDSPIKVKEAINDLLNRKVVALSEEPPIYKRILEELYVMGMLLEPEKENKRYCVNGRCCKQFIPTWEKGYCAECGNLMKISGEYFTVTANPERIRKTILDQLNVEGFKGFLGERRFNKRKTRVIEVYTSKGGVLVVPCSKKIDSNLLEYLKYNDAAVVFVPYPHTSETQAIRAKGHGVVTVTDLIFNKLNDSKQKLLSEEINSCLTALMDRVSSNGKNALERIEKQQDYDFHKFEEDTYSLFHLILPSAQRLGDQFIGKRVSDGIAAVPLDENNRFCITWDCKYAVSVYDLKEKPSKTAHYLEKLSQLPIVRSLGGLETFIFVSNNLPEKKFKRFAKKVRRKYAWRGRMILMSSSQLIELSKHVLGIRQNLIASPEANHTYYQKLAQIFSKPRRKIYAIKSEEIASITGADYGIRRIEIGRNEV